MSFRMSLMNLLLTLLLVGLCNGFPKSRRQAGYPGHQVVGSADPAKVQAARMLNVPNVRRVNPPTDRVDMFGAVGVGGGQDPTGSPVYTHNQGAIEVTGGIVNLRGGMVNAVGGVINVVGARINRIPAPVYSANRQPTYGVRTAGNVRNPDPRRMGTFTLTTNPGIVNTNDSTVTIVGGTVNLFEGYSMNDPNLPFSNGSPTQPAKPTPTTPPSVPAVTTTTTTTPPSTTSTPPPTTTTTTTPPPTTTLSPIQALYRRGCEDAFARAEFPVPITGFGPLDDDCGIYVKCERRGSKIIATYSTCPDKEWFSNATGICGIPDGTVCPWSPCNGVTALFVPDPKTCYGYFECEGGTAQYATCPPGYFFSNQTFQCHQDILDSCVQTTSMATGELLDYLADLRDSGLLGVPMSMAPAAGNTGTGVANQGCYAVGEAQYRKNGVLMMCRGGTEFHAPLCRCI